MRSEPLDEQRHGPEQRLKVAVIVVVADKQQAERATVHVQLFLNGFGKWR